MILGRWYNPADEELIYHYCRKEAFESIIRSNGIWLSASDFMNDGMERKWGYSIFVEVLMRLEPETNREFISRISGPIAAGIKHSMLMIVCFSLDGDKLSQWRDYADEGRGFAIGFTASQLKIPAKKLRVLYEKEAQIAELSGNLRHVFAIEREKGFTYDDEFQSHMVHMGLDLCAYKQLAFQEEKEIRLTHSCGVVSEGDSQRIIPTGARNEKGERLSDPLPTLYRISNGKTIPYVVVEYSSKGKVSPVKQVTLGPRNPSDEPSIEAFLKASGLSEVKLGRSKLTYA
jgi:hypothetical protein